MNAFSAEPPEWTHGAIHSTKFCCPRCQSGAMEAANVWINRRSPVMTEEYRRIWQEFYSCQCGQSWWAWSSDRPPNPKLINPDEP